MSIRTTPQIRTRYADSTKTTLVTELVERERRELRNGELLIEVLYVPLHGSFWLASHPAGLHPRKEEFLESGGFVFGNGGVGRVVASSGQTSGARVGDYVTVFGHSPCRHDDCTACTVYHRYTECEFNESTIIGHGKGAHDGTYAGYAILPPFSYDVCYRAEEQPRDEELLPFMYAFLMADVRNALTRHPDTFRKHRMLLFGAGQSGHLAAYLHLRATSEARVVVVEASAERAASLKSLDPDAIEVCVLPADLVARLNSKDHIPRRLELRGTIDAITETMLKHFGGRLCNLLFDASSGNTAPLWDNPEVLSSACHCLPFGFGSDLVRLDSALIQVSGLTIQMSRGVGSLHNRREVINVIKEAGGSRFMQRYLAARSRRLTSLDEAIAFIREQHVPSKMLHEIPHAYITTPLGETR